MANEYSNSDNEWPNPKRLKTLASNVEYAEGNNLLHQFVLDNSPPHKLRSASYLNAHLLTISNSSLDVNQHNWEGYSPLHLAVLKNNSLMVKKLLSCLANIDVNRMSSYSSQNEDTALNLASALGHLDIVEALLNKEAGIDVANASGETALYLAARYGHFDIIKLLVGKVLNNGGGNDINAKNKIFETPLRKAVYNEELEILKVLLHNGADFNAMDERGQTLLHYAVVVGPLGSIALLIDKGANVNAKDEWDQTPLHTAVICRFFLEVTKMLIERGADVNATDKNRKTPLHHLVEFCTEYRVYHEVVREKLEKVRLLLEGNADVNIKDKNEETPLCRAMRSKSSELIELFSESATKPKSIKD